VKPSLELDESSFLLLQINCIERLACLVLAGFSFSFLFRSPRFRPDWLPMGLWEMTLP